MRDLVSEDGRTPCVVSGQWENPREDDDLAARQAVGIGLVLLEQRHSPSKRRLVTSGHCLDALRHALDLQITGAGRDDSPLVLAKLLRVLLVPQLHLLLVGEADVLDTVGDRRLLTMTAQKQHPN